MVSLLLAVVFTVVVVFVAYFTLFKEGFLIPRNLIIIAVFYALPVVQLVFTYQRVRASFIHLITYEYCLIMSSPYLFYSSGFECQW